MQRLKKPSLQTKTVVHAHKKFEKGPFDWDQSSAEIMQAKAKMKAASRAERDEAARIAREDPFWLASVPERLKRVVCLEASLSLSDCRERTGALAPLYEEVAALYCQKFLVPLNPQEQHRRLCFRGLCYSDKLMDEMTFELEAMGHPEFRVSLFGMFCYIALAQHLGWIFGNPTPSLAVPEASV